MSTTDTPFPVDRVQDLLALARRYNEAFAACDVEGMRACYAPDAAIVQLPSGRTLSVDDSIRAVPWLHRKLDGLRVEGVKATVTTDGFVLQYLICGTNPSGQELRSPTCLVVTAGPEGITRLEEYFDRVVTDAFAG